MVISDHQDNKWLLFNDFCAIPAHCSSPNFSKHLIAIIIIAVSCGPKVGLLFTKLQIQKSDHKSKSRICILCRLKSPKVPFTLDLLKY